MKSFARFLVGIVIVLLFIICLLTSTFKFKLLDKSFWITTFNRPLIYQSIQNIADAEIQKMALSNDRNKLPAGAFTKVVTEKIAKEIVETNITNILDYLNGRKEKMLLFIPFKKLGIPTVLNEEIDFKMLATISVGPRFDTDAQIDALKNTGRDSTIVWLISVILLLLFITLHIALTPVVNRYRPTGRLFISTSLIILVLSIVLELFVFKSQILPELRNGEPIQVLLGTLLPPFTTQLLWFIRYLTACVFITGVLLLLIKPNEVKS